MVLVWGISAFAVSILLTGLLRAGAQQIIPLDIPNERSSHSAPTPRGGGLSIVLTFLVGSYCLMVSDLVPSMSFYLLFIPGSLIAFIGLVDDVWTVNPLARLFFHFSAAILFIYYIDSMPVLPWFSERIVVGSWGYLLAALGLVWCINLNNFMDGIDGLASIEAICVTGGAAFIIWLTKGETAFVDLLLLLAAATAGFLIWNWPPAKIFMGDAGSGFLGFIIGSFALMTSTAGGINLWSWIILYGVFVVDATVALTRRVLRGERFYQAHRSHAYQIMARKLKSHKKVTVGVLGINMLWLFPLSVISSMFPDYSLYCFAVAYFPLLLTVIKLGSGTTNQ